MVTNQNSQFRDLAMEIDKMPALHNEGNTPPLGTTAQKLSANPKSPPNPPNGGGGGNPDLSINNQVVIDNHQNTINHNHCPLDDCELFTEHRYPEAIARHIEEFFGFLGADKALDRYGPDIVNKSIAYMRYKREKENFIPEVPGGYLRTTCEEFLKGANTPTGAEGDKVQARFKDHRPKRKSDDRNKYVEDYQRAHRND